MAKKVKEPKVVVHDPDAIPFNEQLAYGAGAFMDGGGVALMACILVKYMTSLGIAFAVASTIFMVAKFWDAISDPIMGFISDNTRSKFGRRKPYLLIGGIATIVGLFLLFAPIKEWGMQQGGMIAYLVVMYLLWNTISTISQVPYCSLAGDISPSFQARNDANTIKLVFSAAGAGLAYIIPLLVLEAYTLPAGEALLPSINAYEFWVIITVVFGVLFGGGLIISAFKVKERIQPTTPKEKFNFKQFVKGYSGPFKNKSFRWHIGMYASSFACADMLSALAVYYATDVWHGYTLAIGGFEINFSSMLIVAPLMVAAVVAFPIVRYAMNKKTKQFAFRIGLPFYIVGGILLAVMDPSWTPPILVPIIAFLMGLGFGGAQMMPWIIFADTVDVAEFATGERPTASYSGMMTLVRKVAGALSVGMIGWILDPIGYIESNGSADYIVQSDRVLLAIRLLMGISIASLIAVSLFSSFKFKVNNKKLERMRYFIDLNREGKLGDITEEEKAERDALIKELYGNNVTTRIYTKEEVEEMKRLQEEMRGEETDNESVNASEDTENTETAENQVADTEATHAEEVAVMVEE